MGRLFLSLAVLLLACRKDDASDGTGGTADTGTPIFGTDHGSIVLSEWLPSGAEPNPELRLEGIFTEAGLPYVNFAQCVLSARGFCTPTLPTQPGETAVTESFDAALLEGAVTRDVGRRVTLGTRKAPYVSDSVTGIGYYLEVWPETGLEPGPLGLAFSQGAWGGYTGTADVQVPSPMEVLSPNPQAVLDFFDNAPVELTWTVPPDPIGQVYLHYDTPAGQRLLWLPDTGSFSLDLTSLGLAEGDTIDLVLGRWTTGTVLHNGNTAELLVQSNQPLRGSWRSIRTPLDVYDQCADAELAPSTPPGNYTGSFVGASNRLNPPVDTCTPFPAIGPDQVVPIVLQDQDLLSVQYQLVADDASLYLVTDCNDASTCLSGADAASIGETESLVYLNDTGGPLRVYVVLDAFADVTDAFNLDIQIDALATEVLLPTCADAIRQGPVDDGSYHGTIAGHADNLGPQCATDALGGEGIAQVELGPGQTMTATVDAPNGDPKLYLMTNCAIPDSCILYTDVSTTTTEQMIYVNGSPFTQNVYLVLDSFTNLGEYFLDLEIE